MPENIGERNLKIRDDLPMFKRDENIISQIWKLVIHYKISEVNNCTNSIRSYAIFLSGA